MGRVAIRAVMLFSVVAALAAAVAAQPSAASVVLPDSPAGRRVAAWLAAFNSGDEATIKQFLEENIAAEARERRPLEERVASMRARREEIGPLEVRRMLAAQADRIVLLARGREDFVTVTFSFEPRPPHGLLTVRLEQATGEEQPLLESMTEAQALAAIRREIAASTAADEFAGTVLIARRGKTALLDAWGQAERAFGALNQTDTKFNLGSINKLFTRVAVAQLAQQGKLTLDDTVAKQLPDYPNPDAANKVTIRHLLDMTSGIGDFFGEKYDATPKDRLRRNGDFLPLFAAEPLAFEPGSKRQYSNGGYVVLGAIVEKASGEDYHEYVRRHVFAPAGMTSTDSFEADVVVRNLAEGYTNRWQRGAEVGDGPRRRNIYSRPARGSAAGGGYSTAEDLLRFANALRGDVLLAPEWGDWMLAGAEPGGPRQPRDQGGLGFAGGAPGISAALEIDLGSDTTIVVLSNLDPPAATDIARRIRRYLEAVSD
jgi:CubicO group peptidase (beta-lactamase class C family)